MSNELPEIVTILRILTAFRGFTMTELAERIGMKGPMLSKRMSGHIPFTFDELRRMAEALRVDGRVWFDEPRCALKYINENGPGTDFKTGSFTTESVVTIPSPRGPVVADVA